MTYTRGDLYSSIYGNISSSTLFRLFHNNLTTSCIWHQIILFCFTEKISYDISEQEFSETQLKLRNPEGITLVVSIGLIWLYFVSFSYNGVLFDGLTLSVNDIIVVQKSSNGNWKLQFFGQNYNFTHTLCTKIYLWAEMHPK